MECETCGEKITRYSPKVKIFEDRLAERVKNGEIPVLRWHTWTSTSEFRTTWGFRGIKWQIKQLRKQDINNNPTIAYRWKTIGTIHFKI